MFKSLIVVHSIAIVALGNTQRAGQNIPVIAGSLERGGTGYPRVTQKNDGDQAVTGRVHGEASTPPASVEASTARLYVSRVVPERYRASYPYVIDVDNKEQSGQNNSVHDYADFDTATNTETRNPSVFGKDEDVKSYPPVPVIEGKTPDMPAWSDAGSAGSVPAAVTLQDRGAFEASQCPTGTVRIKGKCVTPD